MTDTAFDEVRRKAMDYLRTRGTEAPAANVRKQVRAAFDTLDAVLAPLTAEDAARRTIAGEWSVQEVVDHLVETHRPGLDELYCLLAGRRPPGEPIPASLLSRASRERPWPWLLAQLRLVHGDIMAALEAVADDFVTDARAPVVMVATVSEAGGPRVAHWVEELDWRAYAMVWRLHVLDHLNQVRKVLAAR